MNKKYLIVNIGSVSKKYALHDEKKELCRIYLEKMEEGLVANITIENKKETKKITESDYENALEYISVIFVLNGFIKEKKEISAIGMRVVASGKFFQENKVIDDEYIKELIKNKEEIPIHVSKVLNEIDVIRKTFPDNKIVGISDSVFHKDMPEYSQLYAIPQDTAEKYELKRYGYHGISIQSILIKIKNKIGKIPKKVIVCHLGGGGSVTAIENGKSIDTSMGFSPSEGLSTSTRVGNIDSVAVLYLSQMLGKNCEQMEVYLNKECGLLGLSGKTSDARELVEMSKKGDLVAKKTLDVFVHGVKKYIGAYVALLNGLDLLVFSGTIGERSFVMREKICENMESLGISINKKKNNNTVGIDAFIQKWSSKVKIVVIKTDEMAEIARETKLIV